jgi:hypothetical protein
LRITDITGRVLFMNDQLNTLTGFQQIEVPICDLGNGFYFVTITSTNEKQTAKFEIFR